MNNFFRDNLIQKIAGAQAEYVRLSQLDHSLLIGRAREIVVENLLHPLISSDFSIGTGKVTDHLGKFSTESDLLVYSKRLIPPILFSQRFGVFPVDSCVAWIEVKSRLNATELKDSIEKCRPLRNLQYCSGKYNTQGEGHTHVVKALVQALFAFDTDLTKKSEMDRYKELDNEFGTRPALDAFCVVGKGTWYWHPGLSTWKVVHATESFDEVIFFLTAISNALLDALETRGHPRVGTYVNLEPDPSKDP